MLQLRCRGRGHACPLSLSVRLLYQFCFYYIGLTAMFLFSLFVKHLARFLLLIFAGLTALPLLAQPVEQRELDNCAAFEQDAEKLACFERLTYRNRQSQPVAPEREQMPEPEQVAVTRSPEPEQAAVTSSTEPEQVAGTSSTLQSPAALDSSIAPAVRPATQVQQDGELDVTAIPENYGREHLPQANPEDSSRASAPLEATVLRVTEGSRKHLYFHLENDQLWRQLEADYLPYPKNRAFNIEISQGFLGDYRLRVEGSGRLVRIRRVK